MEIIPVTHESYWCWGYRATKNWHLNMRRWHICEGTRDARVPANIGVFQIEILSG